MTVLVNHPRWRGVLGFNVFANCVEKRVAPPFAADDGAGEVGEWTDLDTIRTQAWFARNYGFEHGQEAIFSAVLLAANHRAFDPLVEYLRGLKWDAKQRLPTVLSEYFGGPDTDYTRAVGVRWFVSAVARALRPGCQADSALVLEGLEGKGKTSGWRALVPVPEWYADSSIDLGNKDSFENIRGVWIYGLDELDSIRKGEATRINNFLTQTRDRYRPPYGKSARTFVRRNVFVGTTNENEYLPSRHGNRRFWPVPVTAAALAVTKIAQDRDQLWAEAVARYGSGEAWYLDSPELRALAGEQQAARVQVDPWEGRVSEWLTRPTMAEGGPFGISGGVTGLDILVECLKKRPGDCTKADEMRVGGILRARGWERRRLQAGGERVYRFVPPDHK